MRHSVSLFHSQRVTSFAPFLRVAIALSSLGLPYKGLEPHIGLTITLLLTYFMLLVEDLFASR